MKAVLLLTLGMSICLHGQSQLGAGAISGAVTDAPGRSITGSDVHATNQDTGLVRKTTTSGTGDFHIPVLPPGPYRLTAEKSGFNKVEQQNINVTVGGSVTLALKLDVGAVSTQV